MPLSWVGSPGVASGTRLLCSWDFSSENTGVGCRFLFQGIVPTQASNPCLCIAGELFNDETHGGCQGCSPAKNWNRLSNWTKITKIIYQEPPWEIPPMTRSCGRELLSKASELKGLPRLSRASTPKPESVCFTISWLSPTPLTLTGGFSWPPFSGKN